MSAAGERGLPADLRVAVLCGGVGSEREVSLESGAAVTGALEQAGFTAVRKELTGDPAEIAALDFPIAFLALHGEYGEDGQVQELLEKRGIPYTGSGPRASALAMDKNAAKALFKEAGIPVAPGVIVGVGEDAAKKVAAAGMSLPVVVKPNSRGSSVGVSIVREAGELAVAVEKALCVDEQALVEGYLQGRELTVGLLDGRALPVIEMVASADFYDYHAKYQDDRTRYLCPAPISAQEAELCRDYAQRGYKALGMRDMARLDFILTAAGPFILEANSIPGFTSHSLLPKAAANAGYSFPELCKKLVEMAWNRRG